MTSLCWSSTEASICRSPCLLIRLPTLMRIRSSQLWVGEERDASDTHVTCRWQIVSSSWRRSHVENNSAFTQKITSSALNHLKSLNRRVQVIGSALSLPFMKVR